MCRVWFDPDKWQNLYHKRRYLVLIHAGDKCRGHKNKMLIWAQHAHNLCFDCWINLWLKILPDFSGIYIPHPPVSMASIHTGRAKNTFEHACSVFDNHEVGLKQWSSLIKARTIIHVNPLYTHSDPNNQPIIISRCNIMNVPVYQ